MAKEEKEQLSCWHVVAQILQHAPRILLWGPPGTGKTFVATTQPREAGRRVYSVSLTPGTPAAVIVGSYMPAGPGKFAWADGLGTKAWKQGAVLVLNELHRIDDEMTGALLTYCESPDTAETTLPTGATIRPAPGFVVIGTMNGNPDELDPALRDRFPISINCDQVHPDALAALPVDIRYAAEHTALVTDERRLSVRSWRAFADLRDACGDAVAAAAIFGKSAGDALDALVLSGAKTPE